MQNKEIMKQAIAVAIGAVLTVAIFGLATFVLEGALIKNLGGVTKGDVGKHKIIVDMQAKLEDIERILELREVDVYHEAIKVKGEGPWGEWYTATYCPKNYYVCGLEQKLEGNQGSKYGEDDTALNGVALRCCRLVSKTIKVIKPRH